MATTSNYGWTTPDDSSLVKDGASAIRALGTAIDTSMNTALGTKKSGLVLLNTTSFTAVASQAVTPVFSATYQNYLVALTLSGVSADGVVYMKLRSGATDNSTGYSWAYAGFTTASVDTTTGASGQTTGMLLCSTETDLNKAYYTATVNLYRPFEATVTAATAMLSGSTSAAVAMSRLGATWHTVESSFDGFNLIASAGNITGTVRTYGYN